MTLDETASRMVAEILDDIATGAVPADVATFADLHDWTDANLYGGAEDLIPDDADVIPDDVAAHLNAARDIVDAWLRNGRPDA